jgi:hypothetical protein
MGQVGTRLKRQLHHASIQATAVAVTAALTSCWIGSHNLHPWSYHPSYRHPWNARLVSRDMLS